MAEPKKVKMQALTRVGHGDNETALPDQEFLVGEAEVERLENLGAAVRVDEKPARGKKAVQEDGGGGA